jgi:Protein of unknown function (DUF732)
MTVKLRRLLFAAVAAVSLSTSTAHADSQDDQFLGLLARDGVNFDTPQGMIATAHERCNANQLGNDSGGFSPWSGRVRSPYTTAISALTVRLASKGLEGNQVDHFMRDAVSVYCPAPPVGDGS